MCEQVNINDFKKELKRRERKEKFERKVQQFGEWIDKNKEMLIVFIPIAIKGVTTVCKVVSKTSNLRKEEQLKDLYCYDRSLGHYWRLRRELTNKKWLEIDKRKKNGERLADILEEMRVLK